MAQIASEIIGHKKLLQSLHTIFSGEQIGSCYLFTGPSGIGKRKVAYALIQNILCTKSNNFTACGECSNCQKVANNQHEEILYLEPDGTQIKVQQASEIHRFLNLQRLGKHRFIIINEAHSLNPQAGNSLLKILEEPPAKTTFFLITHSEHSVLRTLRSRSQIIHFATLDKKEIQSHFQLPDWIVASSQGRLDIIETLKDPEQNEVRIQAFESLLTFAQGSFKDFSQNIKNALKDKENALKILSFHQQFIRDAIYLQNDLSSPIHSDQIEGLKNLAQLTPETLHTIFESLLQLEKDLFGNIDKQLAYENLYLQTPIKNM